MAPFSLQRSTGVFTPLYLSSEPGIWDSVGKSLSSVCGHSPPEAQSVAWACRERSLSGTWLSPGEAGRLPFLAQRDNNIWWDSQCLGKNISVISKGLMQDLEPRGDGHCHIWCTMQAALLNRKPQTPVPPFLH